LLTVGPDAILSGSLHQPLRQRLRNYDPPKRNRGQQQYHEQTGGNIAVRTNGHQRECKADRDNGGEEVRK
jgi:hypothetical protein